MCFGVGNSHRCNKLPFTDRWFMNVISISNLLLCTCRYPNRDGVSRGGMFSDGMAPSWVRVGFIRIFFCWGKAYFSISAFCWFQHVIHVWDDIVDVSLCVCSALIVTGETWNIMLCAVDGLLIISSWTIVPELVSKSCFYIKIKTCP